MSSNIPGLVARSVNSPHAGLIDAGAGALTGRLQGGNISNAFKSSQDLIQGKKVLYNGFGLYSTVKGYYDFGREIKNTNK
ncbi:hypothetical protein [Flavobacterium sp. JP2137]|uniref:hypothetical protein n=1 Tax=Flavobacterium sp. JP2137 TaxID=3414510 RepID=UPI003D2FEFF4